MYKLRTMRVGEAGGGAITGGGDRRVFPVGRVIRRLKIDELPQLVNVARGEMAFVGPRPEAPEIVHQRYEPWMVETLSVPPGVVGPGSLGYFMEEDQIPSDRAEAELYYLSTLLPRKLARDLVFVRNRTVGYQIELIARTLLGIFGMDGLMRRRQEVEETEATRILDQVRNRH